MTTISSRTAINGDCGAAIDVVLAIDHDDRHNMPTASEDDELLSMVINPCTARSALLLEWC